MLFAEADTLIQVPVSGLVTAAGMVAGAVLGAAKMYVAYLERRDGKESADRLSTRQDLSAMRAENVALFRDVMVIQRQTVETLGSLQREIARAMDKTQTDHHPALPADRRRAADDEG